MGWTKLASGWPRNPKVMALSDRAKVADLAAMCFCSEQLTDGQLPKPYLLMVPRRVYQELVEAGRWEVVGEQVWVHDYLVYNPSKSEVEATRDARSNAASIRWSNARSKANVLGDGTGRIRDLEAKESFERFWSEYPRRVGKPKAQAAFVAALGRASPEDIIAGAKRYATDRCREDAYTAHPTTWLHQGRWQDEGMDPNETTRHLIEEAERLTFGNA